METMIDFSIMNIPPLGSLRDNSEVSTEDSSTISASSMTIFTNRDSMRDANKVNSKVSPLHP